MWNVRGLNNIRKQKVLHYMQRHKVDIAYLQETHLPKSDAGRFALSWGQHRFFANYSGYARGTAILIHKCVPFQLHSVLNDNEGRFTIVAGKLIGNNVLIVCVYAPNMDSPEFFRDIHTHLTKAGTERIIMGRDLNLLINPVLDSSSITPSTKPRA